MVGRQETPAETEGSGPRPPATTVPAALDGEAEAPVLDGPFTETKEVMALWARPPRRAPQSP